jgi:hypothetical protein
MRAYLPKKNNRVHILAIIVFAIEFSLCSIAIAFTAVRMNRNANRIDYNMTSKVVPPATRNADSHMGFAMAISPDGTTMIAGAPIDGWDAASSNYLVQAGAANVYIKSGSTWVFQQKLVAPTRRANALFGRAVAVSADVIVVGAPQETHDEADANSLSNAGAAYVFTRTAGTWTFRKKLIGTGTNGRMNNDQYGYSVGVDNGTIAVGIWYQDYDAAGAGPYVNAAGAVMIYTGSGSTWTFQQRLVASSTTGGRVAEARMGCSLSLRGNDLLVGAQNESLDESGLNSLSDAGAAYVFVRSGSTWSQQAKLVAKGSGGRQAGDSYGMSVSFDGDTAIASSYSHTLDNLGQNTLAAAGAAYIYTRSGTTWSFQQKIIAEGKNARNANDRYSSGVAVSGDIAVVGSFYHQYDAQGANSLSGSGAAFVYKRFGNIWKFQRKLVGTGTNGRNAGDEFGGNVAAAGDTVAITSRLHKYDETGANAVNASGAVFIFDKK